ncbi:MAG: class I SAM-dependent RNA methyltransferase [Candidatus Izemoplasmatales bacterium]|jgi:putative N6-adenine-specific DNA methylase
MEQFELIATTTFGIEAVVKRELLNLGFEVTRTENGKVTFLSDLSGIAKANLWLRSADRVLLKIGEFTAVTFDELFDQTFQLDWGKYIVVDGKFTVNGKSVKSTLFSISDCQSIVKKAIVENLKRKYDVSWFAETGADYTVLISILNDVATLTIDTSGVALHKRGYRIKTVKAPLKETLAAAMIMLSYWNKDRVLYDVFCGSGTIPIEAALIGKNIAPGLHRDFSAKHWPLIGEEIWKFEIEKAVQSIDHESKLTIYAYDIDSDCIEAAIINAELAQVRECITFQQCDFLDVDYHDEYGILICNPPYGERLSLDEDLLPLYLNMEARFSKLKTWSIYILTAFEGFSNLKARKPDRVRKLYNGNIETMYFQYYGPRPAQFDKKHGVI